MQIARPSNLLFAGLLALILGGGTAVVGAVATPWGAWLGLLPVVLIGWYALRRPLRRWRAARRSLPAEARAWLGRHVAIYAALPPPAKRRFERDVQFVLSEWTFEGVEGVAVTEELRLGVAAGVALLLHGRPDWELSPRHTVLFYPDRFDDDYFEGDYGEYDGMAHAQGPIILSTGAVEASWTHPGDGHNVVLHELAHLFDFHNSFADGVPSLLDPASAEAWAGLVRQEMQRIRVGKSILRRYGATDPAEFFAVAVEVFFERPEALARRHPELFEALAAFFHLDPRTASGAPAAPSPPVGDDG